MFRQSVNMWAGSFWYVVMRSCRVWCMAIISACRIFCNPGNLLLFVGFKNDCKCHILPFPASIVHCLFVWVV
jgi:hypothetical protein